MAEEEVKPVEETVGGPEGVVEQTPEVAPEVVEPEVVE